MSTTITDSNGYSNKLIDKERFNKLSENDKKIFEIQKSSLLEIMPLIDNKHSEKCFELAENFAFISLGNFKIMFDKLTELETKINSTKV